MGDESRFNGAFNIPVVGREILMAGFERFDLGDFLHESERAVPSEVGRGDHLPENETWYFSVHR